MEEYVLLIISIIQLIFRLVPFGLIIYIYVETNNEFNDKIPDYPFINEVKNQFSRNICLNSNQCICNNESYYGTCTQEQEVLGCININPEIEKLRNLVMESECVKNYQLISEKEKISEIFDLNLPYINLFALIQLIVICATVIFNIVLILMGCIPADEFENVTYRNIGMLTVFFELTRLAGLIFFWTNYTHSNISEYLDILDCPDINKDMFPDYDIIDKLDNCIITFIVFTLYGIIGNIIVSIYYMVEHCDDD